MACLLTKSQNANEVARNGGAILFGAASVFVYIFMFKNLKRLIELFQKWRYLHLTFHEEDTDLPQSVGLILGLIVGLGFLENLLWNLVGMGKACIFHRRENQNGTLEGAHNCTETIWEAFYMDRYKVQSAAFPFHVSIAGVLFICNKFALHAWNFNDAFISCIARSFYKKFQMQVNQAKVVIFFGNNVHNRQLWIEIAKDHEKLVDLLDEFNEFLSSLIFTSTFTNMYYICLTLHTFLIPIVEQNTEYVALQQVYPAWAFVQLIIKTFMTIICCAKVTESAHQIEKVLVKCPVSVLPKEVKFHFRSLY